MSDSPNRQYFNDAQYYALAMNTRDEVIVAGRGVGKGAIQARRLQSCFQGMPGSMGGFVAPSVKRCLTNILPSMLIHLERWGFKRDLHYVVGKRPWKKLHWKSPIFTPANWENTIAFYNGSVCNVISQDRSGTSNSMSLDYLIIDEAKFIDFEQLKDETFQANRGNEMYFRNFPLHHGMTITSDMPITKKGSWFLAYKDKQDPELVECIEGMVYQIWRLRQKLLKKLSLADICDVLQGKNVDKKKTNDCGEGIPIVVGASDIIQGKFVPKRWCNEKLSMPTYSMEGDILVSVVGTLGKMGVNTDGPAILSKHVCALRPKNGVSRQYLMAVVSRLLLDAIPDTADDVVLGFQNKVDIDTLKRIRFTLPQLFIQEWLVSRLTSIATMILAYKGKKEDFLSCDGIISVIEQERKEQRAHMRKLSDKLRKLADMLDNLPPDSDTLSMITDARSAYSRLLKIQ